MHNVQSPAWRAFLAYGGVVLGFALGALLAALVNTGVIS
jgi:hypothetical protein